MLETVASTESRSDLVSKRTRIAFREFLVGWVLRDIEDQFDAAGVACDRNFVPAVSGQRRTLVEQHYHTLDFSNPVHARRLVQAYGGIIERARRSIADSFDRSAAERAVADLETALAKDGLAYKDGVVIAKTNAARQIFDEATEVSEVTRRAIFDELTVVGVIWSGQQSETDFLGRIFDLAKLPTTDGRFANMEEDIWQHRENNLDWSSDWVFSDPRLNLLTGPDGVFFRFLCQMVHPVVRPETDQAVELVASFNEHLSADGWELASGKPISGRPTFFARQRNSTSVVLSVAEQNKNVLTDEYVRELSQKCDARLASGDLDGAITVARTLLEAILVALEMQLAGSATDFKGDLPRQYKQVTKLLRLDDARSDLDERFKDVVRGLVAAVNGLAPLRNKVGDSHPRVRKPATHHARLVVNAAKTISTFLIDSFLVQQAKGLLAAPVA